jgi:hypothetical protein
LLFYNYNIDGKEMVFLFWKIYDLLPTSQNVPVIICNYDGLSRQAVIRCGTFILFFWENSRNKRLLPMVCLFQKKE